MAMLAGAGAAEGGAAAGVGATAADVGGYSVAAEGAAEGGGIGGISGVAGGDAGITLGGGTASGGFGSAISGVISSLQNYFSNPENLKALGKAVGNAGTAAKAGMDSSGEIRRMFQEMAANVHSQQLGGAKSQAENRPAVGSMSPTGPFMGDAANYRLDPNMARNVLKQLGLE